MKLEGLKNLRYSLFGLTAWVWLFYAFLFLVKMWLVSGQRLFAVGPNIHDDMLFLNLASAFIEGEWLGAYNQLTLVKGMFYPFWIAMVHSLGAPLLGSQHILYGVACIICLIAIKPLFRNNWMPALLFIILLFNPVSYADGPMTRALREGIYPALTILITSGAIALLLRSSSSGIKLLPWSVILGISLSAFWLTREEGIWIIPFVVALVGAALLRILRENRNVNTKVLLCLLPFFIWFTSIGIVAGMNYIRYGTFVTVDVKSPEFLGAYGALTRVKHENWLPVYPLPSETRKRIYQVSPAFAELRTHFDEDIGGWASNVHKIRKLMERDPVVKKQMQVLLKNDPSGVWKEVLSSERKELLGGDFVWTLRYAVAAEGYYRCAKSAAEYYATLAKEVNQACDEGQIECLPERSSLMPPWHTAYTIPLLKTIWESLAFLSTFEDVNANSSYSIGSKKGLERFKYLTGERLSLNPSEPNADLDFLGPKGVLQKYDAFKVNLLNKIKTIYQYVIPIFVCFSLISYVAESAYFFWSWTFPAIWVIKTGLLLAIISRSIILSLVHVTSFPAINTIYLAPSYPLVLMFTMMAPVSRYFIKGIQRN